MEPEVVEHEYPYRHSLAAGVFFFLFFGLLTATAFWWATTDHGDLNIRGIVLRGGAALVFRWVGFASLAVVFAVSVKFLWNRVTNPGQRIAFTAKGIFLPRTRWSTKEEFVEYHQIGDASFQEYARVGVREVTFLRFTCPQGRFSIARQKLTKADFDEICQRLLRKVQEARDLAVGKERGPMS